MIFDIRFSPKAIETYESVTAQLRDRWDDKFVTKFEDKLEKCVDKLKRTPLIYPLADADIGLRKCVIHSNCSMFYRVLENKVLIDYFWDNRQEPLV